jgi:hypothetical protein
MSFGKYVTAGILVAGSYVAMDYNGYGFDEFYDSFQDRNVEPVIPPHKQGSIEIEGRERLGSIAQFVLAGAEKERVVDRAYGFRSTLGISDIYLDDNLVYESYADNKVMYLTKSENGRDVGFDVSELSIELQAPEADLSDGIDDNDCATPLDDIEYRGCETTGFVDSGFLQGIPGLGADNNGNLGYKINKVDELFQTNNRCLFDYYLLPRINTELALYGEELNGSTKYTDLAKHLVRGAIRLQQFEAGVPPQRIEVNVVGEYIPDITLQAEFDDVSRNDSQNIDSPEVPDDWCVLDSNGQEAIKDLGDISLLAHLGRVTVAPYFNPSIREVDLGNEFFAPIDKRVFDALKSEYGL